MKPSPKIILLLASAMVLHGLSDLALAASSDSDNQNSKKKTVGELLQQADRGGKFQAGSKSQTALPSFNAQFAGQLKNPKEDLSMVKPPRTSTFLEAGSDDSAKLEKITDQQIAELFKLVQRFKDSPRRGELWLRLAELYVEKAGIIDFRKQTEYDAKLKEFHAGTLKVKPQINLADAKEYNRKAIQLYEWFVRDFPKDDKLDQALFFLGYNYFEINDLKKGLYFYSRLTKEYPRSTYVTESHFALGEYYFENEKWRDAQEHYLEVVRHPRHRLAGFSTYKIAWCYFRLGHTKEALATLEKMVLENRRSEQQDSEGKKISKQRLEKEALRDLVLFYSEDNSPQAAPEYFSRVAGKDYLSYLEKLAYLDIEKGHRDGAKYLFEYLIAREPATPKAFDYKFQIIQAFATAAQTREFRDELYSWVHDYGPGSKWYVANASNTALIESSTKLRETTLKSWVLTQHQTAQNSHAKFSQGLAYEGYKIFLQEFPTSAALPDVHFFYAELLYDMDRFEEASNHYQWVVDNAPQSKYAGKAAENIILALEKNLPTDKEIAATVGKSVDPVALAPKSEHFVKAGTTFIEKYPQSPKAAEMKFRIGRLYYQHNQFDKAIPYFKDIVRDYPKSKYAEYSANLMLDSYNLKKDYAGLEKSGQELLSVPSISGSAAGSDIRGVLEKAQFKKAQDLEVAKDYAGSAQQFEAFANQNTRTSLAAVALFNAAINYERAGNNAKAIENHRAVLSNTTKEATPFKSRSKRIIGKLYQDAGMLPEAANAFKAAAEDSGKDPLAANLYYDAAVLNEMLGRQTEAINNYRSFYESSRKLDRVDALFQIGQIHLLAGHSKAAAESFKEYYQSAPLGEKSVEAAYWNWDHYREANNNKETLQWRQRVLSTQSKLAADKKGPGSKWAAKVALADVMTTFYEMRSIKIVADPAKQQKAAQKKIELLTEINRSLGSVIKYDSADEVVGALVLSGRANQHVGEALVNAPIPPGFKPEEEKAYRAGIQKVADPFFAKARESFRGAMDRGQDLEAYGKDLAYAREMVQKNDPAAYSDNGEIYLDEKLADWTVGQ